MDDIPMDEFPPDDIPPMEFGDESIPKGLAAYEEDLPIPGDLNAIGTRASHLAPAIQTLDEYLIPGTGANIRARYAAFAERAREGAFALVEKPVVIIDTETTGLDVAHDALTQIAAARMEGPKIVARFNTFVNPGRHIPAEIVELTGITDEDVKDAPTPAEAVAQLAEFVGDADLVAHNAEFDQSVVMRQARPGTLMGSWIDTVALSRIVLPRIKSHRLIDLANAFGLYSPTHRADDDVTALCGVWRILLMALADLPAGMATWISKLSPETDWPLRQLFQTRAAAEPGVDFSLRRLRSERVRPEHESSKADAEGIPLSFPSERELRGAFLPGGTASSMYPGYEIREEQVAMALEVGAAFRENGFRALEAGTGVGKSMAYLLPAALSAKRNGITVGVATKTNALMDQLIYHELPRLSRALGSLSYVALKGYEHYPCLRKVERMAADGHELSASTIEMVATIASFTGQTSWGDLDAINFNWYSVSRSDIEANPTDCLKSRCPFYPHLCFLHGARRAADSADIVVTNHALLFRDIEMDNGILPPIRHWIIDEAHATETEARRQLSCSITARDLNNALLRLSSNKSGTIARVRRTASGTDGGDILYGITADITAHCEQIQALSSSFFSYVKDLAEESNERQGSYDRLTLWVGPDLRASGTWATLERLGGKLSEKLGDLVRLLRDLISRLEGFDNAFTEQKADLSHVTSAINAMREALELVLDGSDETYVYSAQLDRRPTKIAEALCAEKLDIGAELAESFYPNTKSVVYTSATLATGDASNPFKHFLHATGLDLLPEHRVATKQLASSYDFENHMTIYLPSDIPDPHDRQYQGELARLLLDVHRAMGGSVLTLFTNRREMEQLYHSLKPQLKAEGIDLAAQVRGISTKNLRDRFLSDEALSLFALKSFWEGFDAPGDTLRCVIIPKLPFGRPSDPLARERELREERAAWRKYSLPEAIMDLKQAAGRLIRNSTDSGSLILADARLQTKGYGKQFLRAMPTHDVRTMTIAEIAAELKERNNRN